MQGCSGLSGIFCCCTREEVEVEEVIVGLTQTQEQPQTNTGRGSPNPQPDPTSGPVVEAIAALPASPPRIERPFRATTGAVEEMLPLVPPEQASAPPLTPPLSEKKAFGTPEETRRQPPYNPNFPSPVGGASAPSISVSEPNELSLDPPPPYTSTPTMPPTGYFQPATGETVKVKIMPSGETQLEFPAGTSSEEIARVMEAAAKTAGSAASSSSIRAQPEATAMQPAAVDPAKRAKELLHSMMAQVSAKFPSEQGMLAKPVQLAMEQWDLTSHTLKINTALLQAFLELQADGEFPDCKITVVVKGRNGQTWNITGPEQFTLIPKGVTLHSQLQIVPPNSKTVMADLCTSAFLKHNQVLCGTWQDIKEELTQMLKNRAQAYNSKPVVDELFSMAGPFRNGSTVFPHDPSSGTALNALLSSTDVTGEESAMAERIMLYWYEKPAPSVEQG